jgi:two-component system sensor histidine kinase ChvG
MPIRREREIVGAVVVSQSTFRILQALYESRLRIFEVVIASIAVAAALSIAAGIRIVRPIVRLRRQANALAARRGRCPPRFQVPRVATKSAIWRARSRLDPAAGRTYPVAGVVCRRRRSRIQNPLASIRTGAELMDHRTMR